MLSAKATILCIDDHWNGLIGRKMLLKQNGYKVLEATGGLEGLKLFLAHPVDGVILDYQMPGMNGDVVAARMKRFRSQVPIMLLSAYELSPKTKLRSVDCFLSKSQPSKTLLATLQNLLDHHESVLRLSLRALGVEQLPGAAASSPDMDALFPVAKPTAK